MYETEGKKCFLVLWAYLLLGSYLSLCQSAGCGFLVKGADSVFDVT